MQTPTHSHRNRQNDTLTILDRPNAHACTRTRKALTELTEFINTWGEFMQFTQAYARAHARKAVRKVRKYRAGRDEYTQLTQPLARARARVGHSENSGNSHQVGGEKTGKNEHFTLQNEHFTLQIEHFTLQPISRNRINKSPAGRWSTPITSITSNKAVPSPLLGAGRATLNQCL